MKQTAQLSFSKALSRLEEIVNTLESPNLDLEDGLKLLEEGVALHKLCKEKLTQADKKISSMLKENDETT